MVSTMGCLAADNNNNNDANAPHRLSPPEEEVIRCARRSKDRSLEKVWTGRRLRKRERDREKERARMVRRSGEEMKNLPTELFLVRIHRPEACQNEEGNIISLPSGSFSPPPSTSASVPPPSLVLSLLFSLIESSNFRLHSPSACLLCRPVRIQRTLCRNLGTRTRWRARGAPATGCEKRRSATGGGMGEKIKGPRAKCGVELFLSREPGRSRPRGKTNGLRSRHRAREI